MERSLGRAPRGPDVQQFPLALEGVVSAFGWKRAQARILLQLRGHLPIGQRQPPAALARSVVAPNGDFVKTGGDRLSSHSISTTLWPDAHITDFVKLSRSVAVFSASPLPQAPHLWDAPRAPLPQSGSC